MDSTDSLLLIFEGLFAQVRITEHRKHYKIGDRFQFLLFFFCYRMKITGEKLQFEIHDKQKYMMIVIFEIHDDS